MGNIYPLPAPSKPSNESADFKCIITVEKDCNTLSNSGKYLDNYFLIKRLYTCHKR